VKYVVSSTGVGVIILLNIIVLTEPLVLLYIVHLLFDTSIPTSNRSPPSEFIVILLSLVPDGAENVALSPFVVLVTVTFPLLL
jgi:hypothetical protein